MQVSAECPQLLEGIVFAHGGVAQAEIGEAAPALAPQQHDDVAVTLVLFDRAHDGCGHLFARPFEPCWQKRAPLKTSRPVTSSLVALARHLEDGGHHGCRVSRRQGADVEDFKQGHGAGRVKIGGSAIIGKSPDNANRDQPVFDLAQSGK